MGVRRMDNVNIIVEDLAAAIAFFRELGLELQGEAPIEGAWADRCIGLDGVRADIAMMVTPDGHGKIELSRFRHPKPIKAPRVETNTLGLGRIMFAVDDLDGTVARLQARGATLVDQVVQYEDVYRLCYLRGPEGILIGLAEELH